MRIYISQHPEKGQGFDVFKSIEPLLYPLSYGGKIVRFAGISSDSMVQMLYSLLPLWCSIHCIGSLCLNNGSAVPESESRPAVRMRVPMVRRL